MTDDPAKKTTDSVASAVASALMRALFLLFSASNITGPVKNPILGKNLIGFLHPTSRELPSSTLSIVTLTNNWNPPQNRNTPRPTKIQPATNILSTPSLFDFNNDVHFEGNRNDISLDFVCLMGTSNLIDRQERNGFNNG